MSLNITAWTNASMMLTNRFEIALGHQRQQWWMA
ncbi:hypothetical protein JOC36_000113 [Weissella uvarum]|nr:hypothetical protein [Weissella uvarum]